MTFTIAEARESGHRDSRAPGEVCWFEAHRDAGDPLLGCTRSQVVVLSQHPVPGWTPSTYGQRSEDGCPLVYRVRTTEGWTIFDAFEDELVDQPEFFTDPERS